MAATDNSEPVVTDSPPRRWSRAFRITLLLLALVGAGAFGWLHWPGLPGMPGLAFLGSPHNDPPTVLFLFAFQPDPLLEQPANPNAAEEFELFRKTQAILITQRFLIIRALDPGKHPLKMDKLDADAQTEPVKWVEDHLQVEFPSPQMMRLTFHGASRNEGVQILRALTDEYLSAVDESAKQNARDRLDRLESELTRLDEEIRAKSHSLKAFQEKLGTPGAPLAEAQTRAYEAALNHSHRLHLDLLSRQSELKFLEARDDEPAVSDESITHEVDRDPALAALGARRLVLQALLAEPAGDEDERPHRANWREELEGLEKAEIARRAALRPAVADRLRSAALNDRHSEIELLRRAVELQGLTLDRFLADLQQMRNELRSSGRNSIDVDMILADLEVLAEIRRQVARELQLQRINIEPAQGRDPSWQRQHSRVMLVSPAS